MTTLTTKSETREDVEEGVGKLARVGFVSRGFVYCLLGVLALQVAFGRGEERLDKDGALRAIARQRYGPLLLGAVALGFAGYALWRYAEAFLGDHELPKRALQLGRGVLYSVFTITAIRLITGRDSGSSNDEQAKSWSARLLAESWGRAAVIAIGVGAIALGAGLAWRGARKKFEKHLDLHGMAGWQREWLPRLGVAGNAARGAVVALIGLFLVRAAVRFDPDEAVGVDGALHELAARSYGPVALSAVALGLVCYGLFSFVEARWRRVLGDD